MKNRRPEENKVQERDRKYDIRRTMHRQLAISLHRATACECPKLADGMTSVCVSRTVAAGPRELLYVDPREDCTKDRALGPRNWEEELAQHKSKRGY